MQVKVSKAMVKTLNAELCTAYYKPVFCYRELTRDQYAALVDYELLQHIDDYKPERGKFAVIAVEYAPEYYAAGTYITTSDLLQLFRGSDRTYNGFITAIGDDLAI